MFVMLFLQVGLVIGKGGETIKYLQQQSGAKIQVARDADSDPRLSTREVEIMGSAEQISHAEQLLKDVIAEVWVQPVLYSLFLLCAQPLLCFTMGDFVLELVCSYAWC
jgi:polyribonucleotide nucleotidyltransferase